MSAKLIVLYCVKWNLSNAVCNISHINFYIKIIFIFTKRPISIYTAFISKVFAKLVSIITWPLTNVLIANKGRTKTNKTSIVVNPVQLVKRTMALEWLLVSVSKRIKYSCFFYQPLSTQMILFILEDYTLIITSLFVVLGRCSKVLTRCYSACLLTGRSIFKMKLYTSDSSFLLDYQKGATRGWTNNKPAFLPSICKFLIFNSIQFS